MEEKKTLLILRLEGVLQAWGDHSKWEDGTAETFRVNPVW